MAFAFESSFAAPKLSFSLTLTAEDGSCRLGHLSFGSSTSNSTSRKIATPGLIAYTRRGAIPHLTRDNVAKLPLEMVHISLEHLVEFRPPPYSQAPFGLHRFIGLHERPTMRQPIVTMSLRDSTDLIELPATQNTGVSASTTRGVVKVSPAEYLAWTIPRPPDILLALDDDPVNVGPLSSKRLRKSIDRSLEWVTRVAEGGKNHTNVFAPLVGSTSTVARSYFAETLAKSSATGTPSVDSLVAGYSLTIHAYPSDSNNPSILTLFKTSLKPVPATKPRLVLGACGPHDILTLVEDVGLDLFVDEWASQCATLGVALDFRFPVGDVDATAPTSDATSGQRDLGHNLFDLSFDRQFSLLSASPLAVSKSGHAFGPAPATRGYVHHLLHSHEMTAHVILALHNELVLLNFFESIRTLLARGKEVFTAEKKKFFEVYKSPALFLGGAYPCMEAAKTEWEAVDKARGKGSLKEKRRLDAEEEEIVAPREVEIRLPLEE